MGCCNIPMRNSIRNLFTIGLPRGNNNSNGYLWEIANPHIVYSRKLAKNVKFLILCACIDDI